MRASMVSLLAVVAVAAGCGGSDTPPPAPTQTQPPVPQGTPTINETPDRVDKPKRGDKTNRVTPESPEAEGGDRHLLTKRDITSFKRLEERLDARLGLVVGPVGGVDADSRRKAIGSLKKARAWGTISIPMALRIIEDTGQSSDVDPAVSARIRQAVTAADNQALKSLWRKLSRDHDGPAGAARAVTATLRQGRDTNTTMETKRRGAFPGYTQTSWSLADQQRFVATLLAGCIGESDAAAAVMTLMNEPASSERWGLATTGTDAHSASGGGPLKNDGYLLRQVGTLPTENGFVVAAIAAAPGDGDAATGRANIDEVVRWLAANVNVGAAADERC